MKIITILRRFFIPPPIVTIVGLFRFRCRISPRAEVELSSNLHIGQGSIVSSFTKIKSSDGPIIIGNNVSIGSGGDISTGEKGVRIGEDSLIGPQVVIAASNYRYGQLHVPLRLQGISSKGITIGKNVWVGAGSCILDGAKIGDNVIISPNSVVSAKIPENTIAQGNPAKVIFTRR